MEKPVLITSLISFSFVPRSSARSMVCKSILISIPYSCHTSSIVVGWSKQPSIFYTKYIPLVNQSFPQLLRHYILFQKNLDNLTPLAYKKLGLDTVYRTD